MSTIRVSAPTVINFNDGWFTGANGSGGATPPGSLTHFRPSEHFWRIPPITPRTTRSSGAAAPVNKRIVYVNGIQTLSQAHANTVKLISVLTGANVCGVYNMTGNGRETLISEDTETVLRILSPQLGAMAAGANIAHKIAGFLTDLGQCIDDKLLQVHKNPATMTLASAIVDSCVSGVPINIVAHSQGAIITSGAARLAIASLAILYTAQESAAEQRRGFLQVLRDMTLFGQIERQVERFNRIRRINRRVRQTMGERVSIQTFGGAATWFPDGPRYRHVNNGWDPVSNLFGQGTFMRDGGRGAQQVQIERNSGMRIRDIADHSIDDLYLQPSANYVDRNGNRTDNNYVPIDMSMVRG